MDFNKTTDSYREKVKDSISFANADSDLILEVKANLILKTLKDKFQNFENISVLDVGCGVGLMDQLLCPPLKNLSGVDIAQDAVKKAETLNPNVHYSSYDGKQLPFQDDFFMACFVVCVLHHVPPKEWIDLLLDIKRTLKTGGLLFVFEHNPWNPLTRLVTTRCELDEDAALISPLKMRALMKGSGFKILDSRAILYFPWRGAFLRKLDTMLGQLYLGGQYYFFCEKA